MSVTAPPGHHKPESAPSKFKRGKQRSKFDGECCGGKQKNKHDGCFICGSPEHKAFNYPERWKGESGNESALPTRVTTAARGSCNTDFGRCET